MLGLNAQAHLSAVRMFAFCHCCVMLLLLFSRKAHHCHSFSALIFVRFIHLIQFDSMTFIGKSNEIRCLSVCACVCMPCACMHVRAYDFIMEIHHQMVYKFFEQQVWFNQSRQ